MSAAQPVVLIAEELSPATVEALGPDFEIRHTDGADRARLLADLPGADAVLIRSATQMDAEAMAAATNLKVIARAGVGLDNVDVPAATAAGVMVVNAPTSNILSAAELTCGHILASARNIAPANAALKQGEWKRSKYSGVELFGKSLGIIGLGRIGALVAERMKAFGMDILAYDPYITAARAQQLGAELVELDELLERADFVTIHMPKTPETVGMLSDDQFERMKDSAFVVNVARGGLVDEEALDRALAAGKIAGAGIDVFASEPATDLPFFAHDRSTVTPHLGASTAEAQEKAGVAVARSVRLALAGELVPDAVNVAGGVIHEDVRPGLPLAENLGRVLTALLGERSLTAVEVEVAGEIAAQDVSSLQLAALKGVFTDVVSDQVSYVNAPVLAEQRGVETRLTTTAESSSYRNVVTVRGATAQGDQVSVSGTLVGPRQRQKLVGVDRAEIEVPLSEHLLAFRYTDRPGVIGILGQALGEQGVNIAGMDVSREAEGGTALAVLQIDSALQPGTLDKLEQAIEAERAAEVDLAER
ncbi:phosphoglycerate dehydrogenase [Micrococcus lylae]|uniref:phosphoglycerate dehydrogenase n=1 Tax=Micrococcus lylae TaxID=1273 RepID=UPI0021A817C1|nr:phosphoglycerate dehydrogenase [Micrococcus lylae]MCT2006636.1 phosphoglycerate dehydrogenase [Micrococcus lylae]MCT2070875.1 phosphoglycerate dehydrogenase [Micrococcus lylae]